MYTRRRCKNCAKVEYFAICIIICSLGMFTIRPCSHSRCLFCQYWNLLLLLKQSLSNILLFYAKNLFNKKVLWQKHGSEFSRDAIFYYEL